MTEEIKKTELNEQELTEAAGGCDGMAPSLAPNEYYVRVAESYLALRREPAFKYEVEIGQMWPGQIFQSYGQTFYNQAEQITYVYGYSRSLGREGWTNQSFLKKQ